MEERHSFLYNVVLDFVTKNKGVWVGSFDKLWVDLKKGLKKELSKVLDQKGEEYDDLDLSLLVADLSWMNKPLSFSNTIKFCRQSLQEENIFYTASRVITKNFESTYYAFWTPITLDVACEQLKAFNTTSKIVERTIRNMREGG